MLSSNQNLAVYAVFNNLIYSSRSCRDKLEWIWGYGVIEDGLIIIIICHQIFQSKVTSI